MTRQGKRAEGARCGRAQNVPLTGPPVHYEIDVERDADAEQQRQYDDVCVTERQQRRHNQGDIERATQRDEQDCLVLLVAIMVSAEPVTSVSSTASSRPAAYASDSSATA
jgi:hypothetical protein